MDKRQVFIFDGISSASFDAYISGNGIFNSPEADYEVQEVDGMNGELHINRNRYKNVPITYNMFIIRNFKENFTRLKTELLLRDSYCRLEDSYYPGRFRLARVKNRIEPDMVQTLEGGSFTVEFDCKPQHFLKSGEQTITLSSHTTLINEGMPSKPLLTVYGLGRSTVTIGDTTVRILDMDEYVTLDCELQQARKELTNKNATVYALKYPELKHGENIISWTGPISKIEIIPRWWVL